ncbi:NAD-dependent histone deacetylase sir2 [Emydomyces testavorans]|uniref:NAD-dependent histone deacetylase sir2 n=1 Tax=Emydomyces testavorans TaxID=2070801 RepID=A0AAF0DNQ0_9EURO|nr:NAD-dependent histone deacetylase sir2 [Emydomyces testavorans]
MDVAPKPAADEGLAPKTEILDSVVILSRDAGDARDVLGSDEDASLSDLSSLGEAPVDQWETESLFEDALQFISDEQLRDRVVSDAVTLEDARAFRKRLRELGMAEFLAETVYRKKIPAKTLCTAFGIVPPAFLEDSPDEAYLNPLCIGMKREYTKRLKLPQYNTIDDAVQLLKRSKNIIVLTGAGISTSLGIPDFRSKDIGLYSKLQYLGLNDPQEVFDISLFLEDPAVFYSVAKDILPTEERFSPTHAFIRLLQDKGKLLTNFTQNIDNLEAHAGILTSKLIQCHGSFATATCVKCNTKVPGEAIFDEARQGLVPECQACVAELSARPQGMKRKRSSNKLQRKDRKKFTMDDSDDEDYNIPAPGVMKPDITFFGEDLPDAFRNRLINHDRDIADLVIVIGTSLKVAPVSEVPGVMPPNVPQLFISRTPVSHVDFDIDMLGDCDVVVAELCRRAGWDLQHEMIPPDQRIDIQAEDGFESRYRFNVAKL